MATRPLTEREREILWFLLSAPRLPDREVLLCQAEGAVVDEERKCPCGCASMALSVDRSAAAQARPLPRPVVTAFANDLQRVAKRHGLVVVGDDGHFDPSRPVPNDLGGYIDLTLWAENGWLTYVEISAAGAFQIPWVFPPPDVFDSPEVSDLLR